MSRYRYTKKHIQASKEVAISKYEIMLTSIITQQAADIERLCDFIQGHTGLLYDHEGDELIEEIRE